MVGGRPNYGPTAQERTKRLLEALLAYANDELEGAERLQIEANWQTENKLVVRTKVRFLEELTAKYQQDGKLNTEQIKEALRRLNDWLKILEDNRTKTKGSEDWHFTLTLWSKDKQENLQRFDFEWESRKAKRTHPNSLGNPSQPRAGIDWQEVCHEMLEAQNQRRLTTNPLTAGDGVTFELDEIYVPLGLVERKQRDRRSGDVSPERGSQLYEPEAHDEIVQTFHEQFFEQVLRLGQSRRIAIIGEPGAGKTTLLQKIATWVLDNTSDVPIWISLADLPQGQTIKDYILQTWLERALPHIRKRSPKAVPSLLEVPKPLQNALADEFCKRKVWLLLDAADEMVVESGNALTQIANQLTGWVAEARVVLTCRLNVWDAGKNALEAFDTYRNLNFSPEEMDEFICRWFNRYPEQGEHLRAALAQPERERIRDVVKNPLRLALVCRMWQFGEGKLPDTRAGLYEQFVEELYKWKQERFPTNSRQRQELNQALGQLALQAIDGNASRFRLRYSFVRKVLGNPEDSQFQLALRLGWLNQVGVAAERNHEAVYAFFHPTFQEYFAAQAIDDWHFFLDHKPHNPTQGTYRIFEPQWKEVIKLWLGREDVEREQKEAFIKALVEFEDKCKGFYRYRAYFLAAAGIAEFRDCSLSDEIVEQILKWAFGCFDHCSHQSYIRSFVESASVALRESERNRVINLLSQIITNQPHKENSWIRLSTGKGRYILQKLLKVSQKEVIKALRELFSERKEETLKVLRELLIECKDERICLAIARLMGRIHPGDPEAVAFLTKLKQTVKGREARYLVTDSLREIVPPDQFQKFENFQQISPDLSTDGLKKLGVDGQSQDILLLQQASSNPPPINPVRLEPTRLENINDLLKIIQTNQNGATRRQAVKNLEKFSSEHIKALIEVLHSTPWKRTRIQAVKSIGEIGVNSPEAIKALIEVLHGSYCNKTHEQAVISLGEIGADNPEATKVLMELLHSSPWHKICHQAVISLGKIGADNPEAIKVLMELLHSSPWSKIRLEAVISLGKIGADNPEAIQALVEVLLINKEMYISHLAVKSLEKIGADSPEAIQALVEVLRSSQDWHIRIQSARSLTRIGAVNSDVITTLIEGLRTSSDTRDLITAYWYLWRILRGSPYSKVVSNSDLVVALKDCLTTQVEKYYSDRYIYCYEILWHCAQNMTYPAFYQAWHNQPAPTQSLAELRHSFDEAVFFGGLRQTIDLIYIDGSKFIDRDNPATKIYTEMVRSGCPKCEDGTPKTMQELQTYWDLLDTDRRVVLVFYEGTAFSETFLDTLSKFDGAICVITAQALDNIPLQCFRTNQAIADIVEWLKKVALET